MSVELYQFECNEHVIDIKKINFEKVYVHNHFLGFLDI